MSKSAFFKGVKFYKKNDYERAEYYFSKCLNSENYGELAYKYLYIICKKTSNYKNFQTLKNITNFDSYDVKLSLANMEMREYNLDSSYNLIMQSMSDEINEDSLFLLSKLFIQLGEFSEAKDILEHESSFFNQMKRVKKLIIFYFLSGDYERALYLLYLNPELYETNIKYFSRLEGLIKLHLDLSDLKPFLNRESVDFMTSSQKKDYVLSLERNKDKINRKVITHIDKHQNRKNSISSFYEDINIINIYDKVSKKVKLINYITKDFNYIYRFKMDDYIGIHMGLDTKDIEVVTTISKKIITMYPILLSDTFNSEEYLENKEVLKKRRIKIN